MIGEIGGSAETDAAHRQAPHQLHHCPPPGRLQYRTLAAVSISPGFRGFRQGSVQQGGKQLQQSDQSEDDRSNQENTYTYAHTSDIFPFLTFLSIA